MAINLFSPTYGLLAKVLDFRSQRHSLVSSNIANADTPHYKASHINFEDELKNAIPSKNKLKMLTTNEKHLPKFFDFNSIKPAVYYETGPSQRADGNTVNMDKEVVRLSKNQLMYNGVAQIIGKKFRGLISAIKEVK